MIHRSANEVAKIANSVKLGCFSLIDLNLEGFLNGHKKFNVIEIVVHVDCVLSLRSVTHNRLRER
jgi:hypothetical protein